MAWHRITIKINAEVDAPTEDDAKEQLWDWLAQMELEDDMSLVDSLILAIQPGDPDMC